jgi:phosphate ABC transporter permease subunit PstA
MALDDSTQLETDRGLVGRRYRRSRRFRFYCAAAVVIALAFLAYFLFDLAYRAYPAFKQAKIHVTMKYTPVSVEQPPAAVPEAKRPFVSRGALRTISLRATRDARAEVKVRVDTADGDPEQPLDAVRPPEGSEDMTAGQLTGLIGSDGGEEVAAELRGEHELVIDESERTPGVRWVWAKDSVNDYLRRFQAVTRKTDVQSFYTAPAVSGTLDWNRLRELPENTTAQVRLLELRRDREEPIELSSQTLDLPGETDYELAYELADIELGRVYLVHVQARADGELVREGVRHVLTDRERTSAHVDVDLDAVDDAPMDLSAWLAEAPAEPAISFERQRFLRRLYLGGTLRRRFNDMIHTKETAWVPAVSDVDQYLQLPKRVRNEMDEVAQGLEQVRRKLDALPRQPEDAEAAKRREALEAREDKLRDRRAVLMRETRLSPAERAAVERLAAAGEIAFGFNYNFFTNGASTLPEQAGIFSATVGTVLVLGLVLVFSFPIGVLTAIYLEEFAPDNKLTQLIEVNINNLAAVPSILFGLLGLAVFIGGGMFLFNVDIRSTALVAGLTLSLMTLPIIIISTRSALRAVPESIRLGAMAMGATRWQTVCHHVLPQSISGILTGTIIGLAQAIGETAPLIIVGLTVFMPAPADGIMQDTTVLPAQIFSWFTQAQGGYEELTAAGILVLLAVLLTMNATAVLLRARFEKRW